jgi:rhodanese-related sulfurtransferase
MTKGGHTPKGQEPRRAFTRRGALLGLVSIGGLAATGHWFNISGAVAGDIAVSVERAFNGARDGDFALIDIRRPDEWARTGVGLGAIPIDMRDRDFVQQLLSKVSDKDAPIALICARGVRSRGMTKRLTEAGFTNIIDVPEGMLGSGAGPGWLATGLPVTAP